MRDLIVNGVPMRDPLQKWRPDYTRSSLLNTVSRATPSTEQIGYHGVDATGPAFFGAGQHTLVLNLEASNREEFFQLLTALQSLFSAPSLDLVSAPQISPLRSAPISQARANRTFNVASSKLREAKARMIGSLAVEYINERTARLTMILELPAAFWSSTEDYDLEEITIEQGVNVVDLTAEGTAGDSTAPITRGLIRIRGPLAASAPLAILDRGSTESGLVVRLDNNLTEGQYILIDLQTANARLLTSDSWSMTAGTDARRFIELTGDGGFRFEPEVGFENFPSTPNRYWVSVSKTDPVATHLEIRIRRSYL